MTQPNPQRRWFRLTPAWLIYGLLVVEAVLWLSERLGLPAWHKGHAVLVAVAAVGAAMLVMLAWLLVSLVFRWRFQFSIRSLLVLTVAVAVACSWLGVEMKAAREEREAVAAIKRLGGAVHYDWQAKNPNPNPPQATWPWSLLGNDFSWHIIWVQLNNAKDSDIETLVQLNQPDSVYLFGSKITDDGVKKLQQALPNCKIVH